MTTDPTPDVLTRIALLEQAKAEHERRLASINGNIAEGAKALGELRTTIAAIGVRVGIGAAVGSLITGAIMSAIAGLIVFLLTRQG